MRPLFHTYILGLPSKFRGEPLEKQLRGYGVEFSRVHGIEPDQLDEFGIRSVAIPDYLSIIPPLMPGEICCSFGHKIIYRKIVDGEFDWGLILEDDAILRINPEQIDLEGLELEIPRIVQLSPDPYLATFSKRDPLDGYDPNPQLVEIATPQLESCAYFINKAAARIIIESTPEKLITSRADWPLESLGKVSFMKVRVFCAFQPRVDGDSQIGDRDIFISSLPKPLRALRILFRVIGVTSLAYKLQGAPFKASYRVEVINPLLTRLK